MEKFAQKLNDFLREILIWPHNFNINHEAILFYDAVYVSEKLTKL